MSTYKLYMITFIFFIIITIILASSTQTAAITKENIITGNALKVPDDTENIFYQNIPKDTFNAHIEQFHKIECIDYKELRDLLTLTPMIKETSYNLTSDLDSDFDIAYALHQYVYKSILYEPTDETLDAEQILLKKRGDCSEKSLLLASLLEARGMKAYVADGHNHRYVFVQISGSWVPIDPTQDFYFALMNWNKTTVSVYYNSSVDFQLFMFNRTVVIFNRNWCTANRY